MLAFAFAATNGLHDASNAIATLVATRAARPKHALAIAAVFNLLGPLLVGGAVARAIGGIVTIDASQAVAVIGAGLLAAVAWNLVTWRWGLPSSSGHALVGGLVGAALVAGDAGAVRWGGPRRHPPDRGARCLHRARGLSPARRARGLRARPCRAPGHAPREPALARARAGRAVGDLATLAFGHGANDAQKSAGVAAALTVRGMAAFAAWAAAGGDADAAAAVRAAEQ